MESHKPPRNYNFLFNLYFFFSFCWYSLIHRQFFLTNYRSFQKPSQNHLFISCREFGFFLRVSFGCCCCTTLFTIMTLFNRFWSIFFLFFSHLCRAPKSKVVKIPSRETTNQEKSEQLLYYMRNGSN